MGDNVFVLLSEVDYWGKSVSSFLIYIIRKRVFLMGVRKINDSSKVEFLNA